MLLLMMMLVSMLMTMMLNIMIMMMVILLPMVMLLLFLQLLLLLLFLLLIMMMISIRTYRRVCMFRVADAADRYSAYTSCNGTPIHALLIDQGDVRQCLIYVAVLSAQSTVSLLPNQVS
jgi:hypothetical protein